MWGSKRAERDLREEKSREDLKRRVGHLDRRGKDLRKWGAPNWRGEWGTWTGKERERRGEPEKTVGTCWGTGGRREGAEHANLRRVGDWAERGAGDARPLVLAQVLF